MRKIFKFGFCAIVALVCGLFFSACKDKTPPAKQNVEISVSVSTNDVYAYGNLPTISASATAGGNSVAGTIVWNAGQTVTTAKTSYEWTFTPYDTAIYNIITGSKQLNVLKSNPSPKTAEFDFDIDANLNDRTFEFEFNGKIVEGSISWEQTTFSRTELGQVKEVAYTFTPNDNANFNTCEGAAKISLKVLPKLSTADVTDAGVIGTQIQTLKNQIQNSFFDNNTVKIEGTATILETSLSLGKNTLHYNFIPTNSDIYLPISGEIDFVAFNKTTDTYLIERADQLGSFGGKLFSEKFKLTKNLELSASVIEKYNISDSYGIKHKVASLGMFCGTLDGNNCTITIDASEEKTRICVFDKLSGAKINNLNILGSGEVVLALSVADSSITTLTNINISGSANDASENYAPFISYITDMANIIFNNCTSDYDIVGTTVSAFVGVVDNASVVRFLDCKISGNIFAKNVGLFASEASSPIDVNYGNENLGTIVASNHVSLAGVNDKLLLDSYGDIIDEISPDNFFNDGEIRLEK